MFKLPAVKSILISLLFIWFFLISGAAVRIQQYLTKGSLWLDEAIVALNVIHRSFASLLTPIDYKHYDQSSPVGFLLIEKLIITFFGSGEYALRFFPLMCGIFSLWFLLRAAQRFLRPNAVPIALGLFALSLTVVRYSFELKPYSCDVLVTLLLWHLWFRVQADKNSSRPLMFLGVAGAFAIWFSHPAIFILASLGIYLCYQNFKIKNWGRFRLSFLINLLWLMSFLLNYYSQLTAFISSPELLKFWQKGFMPFPPTLAWFYESFLGVFAFSVHLFPDLISLALFISGVILFIRRKKSEALIFLLPVAGVLLASLFHKYPFEGRQVLFLSPVFVILIAEGIEGIIAKIRPVLAVSFVILLVSLAVNPAMRIYSLLTHYLAKEEIRPVLNYLKTHFKNGDIVYVYYGADPAFHYYQERLRLSFDRVVIGTQFRENPEKYIQQLEPLRGEERVWVLFSHMEGVGGFQEAKVILDYLESVGHLEDLYDHVGAGVGLYNLNPQ
jgi:hypothetical protein